VLISLATGNSKFFK